jgi:trk system potassium uptake protein TrkH
MLPRRLLRRLPSLRPLNRIIVWWHELSAHGLFVASFLLLIAIGTAGLLWLPGLYVGERLSLVDALFTMTSAVCVTGLAVVDTATFFTRWGQLWLLIFIQLGGLGLVALTTMIIGALGRRLSLRSEMIAGIPAALSHRRPVSALTLQVARFTFAIEGIGALLLWIQWAPRFGVADATWYALFHSVSAFCNAGLSTFPDSMLGMNQRPFTLLVISLLVAAGATGYLSLEELQRWRKARRSARPLRMSSHTFAVLWVTGVLTFGGTVLFAAFEWDAALAQFGFVDKLANAWFMSVASRSGGFHSIPYSQVGNATAYLTILLMFVGGAPGSTGGGIKTTSAAVLIALAVARVRGRRHVILHDRTVPDGTVQRTVSLTLVAFILLSVAIFAMGFLEPHPSVAQGRQNFLPQMFEVASALANNGLSMDLTPTLGPPSRLMLTVLMFVGRVGPLSFFAAISVKSSRHPRDFRPAREDVIIG